MANRKADCEEEATAMEEHAVFVDTSLNTHLALLVSHLDTFSLIKQKILLEHPKCFPDIGEIKINALRVKRKGCYYHLPDSMLVRTAFHGLTKSWFLFAEASRQITNTATLTDEHDTICDRPSRTLPALVGSLNQLESKIDCDKNDHVGTYSSKTDEMLISDMPNKFHPSNVNECQLMEESLKPEGSKGKIYTKKRKRQSKDLLHDVVDENDGENHVYTGKEYMIESENVVPEKKSLPHRLEVSCNNMAVDDHICDGIKSKDSVDDEDFPSSPIARKKLKVTNNNAPEAPLLETKSLFSDPNGGAFEPETIVNESDIGDIQKIGLPSNVPQTSKDSGKRKKKKKHAGYDFLYSEIGEKEDLKDLGDITPNASVIATDAAEKTESIRGTTVEDDDIDLVKDVPQGADLTPQLEGESLFSGPNGGAFEPETIVNESDIGDIQKIGLPSNVPQTPKGPGKRKKKKRHAGYDFLYSEISEKKDLKDLGDITPNASVIAIDAAEKTESVRGTTVEDDDIDLIKDVPQGADLTPQLEGLGTNSAKLVNNENEVNKDGLTSRSRAKKTNKAKKDDFDGDTKRHPTTSSEVLDIPKKGVAPSENESAIHDSELDEPLTLPEREREKETEENIVPFKSVDTKGISELGSTVKKRKTSKAKNSVTKKQDSSSAGNHQDVEDTQISPNGPVENHNKYHLTNEADKGEIVFETDKTKDMNETMELGITAKEKKMKKGKSGITEKLDVSSMENSKEIPTCINSNGAVEEPNDYSPAGEVDIGKREIIPQNDGREENVVEPLQQAEINKPEHDVEIRSEKPKKRTKKKKGVQAKDAPEFPVDVQFDEKTREMTKTVDGDLLINSDVNGAKHERESSKGDHEEFNEIPLPEVSKPDKAYTSKQKARKLDLPSSMDTSSNGRNLRSKRKFQDGTQPQNDDMETDYTRQTGDEKPEESVEIRSDKPKKRTQKKQTVLREPPKSPLKQPLHEKTREMAAPKSADNHLLTNNNTNGPDHHREGSVHEGHHELRNDDVEAEYTREIGAGPMQTSQGSKLEENVETRSEKPKKRTQKKQTVFKEPPETPLKQQSDEKMREMAVRKSADGDLLTNSITDGTKHRREVSVVEGNHEEFNEIPPPGVSTSLAEVKIPNKPPQASKQKAKLDLPSSVDTSNGYNLIKSKKIGIDPINSVVKLATKRNQNSTARKHGIVRASADDGSKSSGASSVSSGSSVRRTHHGQAKKATEPQKKLKENKIGFLKKSSSKNMGEVFNASARKKSLLGTSTAIFEDESSASSDEDKRNGSDSSTRTPSDNLSSSDYSEAESKGQEVTSQHGSSKGGGKNKTKPSSSGLKNLPMESILRSSSRYKKAKIAALQSQLLDSESQPVDFVPDSQANP